MVGTTHPLGLRLRTFIIHLHSIISGGIIDTSPGALSTSGALGSLALGYRRGLEARGCSVPACSRARALACLPRSFRVTPSRYRL